MLIIAALLNIGGEFYTYAVTKQYAMHALYFSSNKSHPLKLIQSFVKWLTLTLQLE